MSKVASSIAARVEKMVAAEGGEAPPDAATSDSASGASAGPPLAGSEASGVESGAAGSAQAGAPATLEATGEPAPLAPPGEHAKLEEKLEGTRAKRAAQREAEAARRARQEADREREAAVAERKSFEEKKAQFRKGNIKQALIDSGEDPRAFFEAMAEEARNAGKPEAIIAQMKDDFDRQMSAAKAEVEDLKKTIREKEEQQQAAAFERAFAGDFNREIVKETYRPLRIEYEAQDLYDIVRTLRDDPPRLHTMAKRLGVRLTAPEGRFNMHDICNVLSAQHAAHERGKEQRRARETPATQTQAATEKAAPSAPTVNGTAEKRNAGNPLGNEAASSRATEKQSPRLTRRQRIEREIDKHG